MSDAMTCAHGVSLMLPCPQCDADAKAHEQRVSEEQQRAADRRIVEFHQAAYGPSPEDAWADEPKSEVIKVWYDSQGRERRTIQHTKEHTVEIEMPEPEDVCKSCGAPHVSHMRSPDDDLCPACRFGRGE